MTSTFTPKGLSGAEQETLWCLFFHGPVWDGNLPSKQGRSDLVERGLADRHDGWNWLTSDGAILAIDLGLGRRKDAAEQKAARDRRSPRP